MKFHVQTAMRNTSIGETSRNLGTRLKKHFNLKACTLSAVGEHRANHQHVFDHDNVRVIAREDNFWRRTIEIREKELPDRGSCDHGNLISLAGDELGISLKAPQSKNIDSD